MYFRRVKYCFNWSYEVCIICLSISFMRGVCKVVVSLYWSNNTWPHYEFPKSCCSNCVFERVITTIQNTASKIQNANNRALSHNRSSTVSNIVFVRFVYTVLIRLLLLQNWSRLMRGFSRASRGSREAEGVTCLCGGSIKSCGSRNSVYHRPNIPLLSGEKSRRSFTLSATSEGGAFLSCTELWVHKWWHMK